MFFTNLTAFPPSVSVGSLMCSERVEQMTKTYNDVDAVTLLLNEKEKDLELAARIGKSLLERNKELQTRNEFLEDSLNATNENLHQMKHELTQKSELINLYSESEAEDSNKVSGPLPPSQQLLQQQVEELKSQNDQLRTEHSHLKDLTDGLEEKEVQLMTDYVRQLELANNEVGGLKTEVAQKSEEQLALNGEITRLLQELFEAHTKNKVLNQENDELVMQLKAAQETQYELTQEILELQERYAEVMAILNEAQEELRIYRKGPPPNVRSGSPLADSLYESLASELEQSDSGFYTTPDLSARYSLNLSDSAMEDTGLAGNSSSSMSPLGSSSARSAKQERLAQTMDNIRKSVQKIDFKNHSTPASATTGKKRPESIPDDPMEDPTAMNTKSPALTTTANDPALNNPGAAVLRLSPVREVTPVAGAVDSSLIADNPENGSATPTAEKGASPPPLPSAGDIASAHARFGSELSLLSGYRPLSKAPSTDSLASYAGPALGEPGTPGTRDLEYAIRRVNLRRKVELDYLKYRRLRGMKEPPPKLYSPSHLNPTTTALLHIQQQQHQHDTPTGSVAGDNEYMILDTNGSIPSGVQSRQQQQAQPHYHHCFPIRQFKPMEGSSFLSRWRELAAPRPIAGAHISSPPRSGIKIKNEKLSPPRRGSFLSRDQAVFISTASSSQQTGLATAQISKNSVVFGGGGDLAVCSSSVAANNLSPIKEVIPSPPNTGHSLMKTPEQHRGPAGGAGGSRRGSNTSITWSTTNISNNNINNNNNNADNINTSSSAITPRMSAQLSMSSIPCSPRRQKLLANLAAVESNPAAIGINALASTPADGELVTSGESSGYRLKPQQQKAVASSGVLCRSSLLANHLPTASSPNSKSAKNDLEKEDARRTSTSIVDSAAPVGDCSGHQTDGSVD